MAGPLDFDEQHTKALSYEVARENFARRAGTLGPIVVGLEKISADVGGVLPAMPVADVEQLSADLMMRQASYRSAAAAVANPIASSLLEFLG